MFSTRRENQDSATERGPNSAAQQQVAQQVSTTPALHEISGFVEICEAIRLKCWKQAQPDGAQGNKNPSFFEDAYRLYKLQVSPSLNTILDSYREKVEVCMRVRNAAAMCLSSLACGIVLAKDLDTAHAVGSEALALVLDEELKTEIKGLLEFIDSEKRERLNTGLASNPSVHDAEQSLAGATASEPHTQDLFSFQEPATLRGPRLHIVVTIVLVIACATGILITGGPARQSSSPVFTSATDVELRTSTASPGFDTIEPLEVGSKPQTTQELAATPGVDGRMEGPEANGLGQLTISNDSGQDAAVKLKSATNPRTTVRFAYVPAKNEVIISGILPGEYFLQFTTGKDWDESRKAFHENQEFSEFEKSLNFMEYRMDGDSIEYSVHKITLQRITTRDIHRKEITAADFADGH